MEIRSVLVTGASGFVGREVVKKLNEKGIHVKAGCHRFSDVFKNCNNVETVEIDILDKNSLMKAMTGVDAVYHFAARVDSHEKRENLIEINIEGTKNVWNCLAESKIKKALYCSSTAVYGLLGKTKRSITENEKACAIEPYGNTKLGGENEAIEISDRSGITTIIIRPVAIFGPGEHTPFGKKFKEAAVSKILIAGGFQNKSFNYVHVEDVAEAAIHLMETQNVNGDVFNICVNKPVLFEEAFQSYIRVLKQAGDEYYKVRLLALVSVMLHKSPGFLNWLNGRFGEKFLFKIWHPGFDLNYSSQKLLQTSFRFKWDDFEKVFYSCLDKQ